MHRFRLGAAPAAALLGLTQILAAQQGQPGAHFIDNWDLDGHGAVSVAEAAEKRGEIFYMFDQNEDGTLDAGEYALFDETRKADMNANAGGEGGPMRGISQAMALEYNDADKDGAVTEAEFLARVPEWFATMDVTGDALVTTADFSPKGGGMGKTGN